MPDIIYTRDAVPIRTDTQLLYAYPPVPDKSGTKGFWTAALATAGTGSYNLDKEQAELLARTIAPQLFPEEGEEPWRKPVREIHKDLKGTILSYTKDLTIAKTGEWDVKDVTLSLSALLEALNGTLEMLEELL